MTKKNKHREKKRTFILNEFSSKALCGVESKNKKGTRKQERKKYDNTRWKQCLAMLSNPH